MDSLQAPFFPRDSSGLSHTSAMSRGRQGAADCHGCKEPIASLPLTTANGHRRRDSCSGASGGGQALIYQERWPLATHDENRRAENKAVGLYYRHQPARRVLGRHERRRARRSQLHELHLLRPSAALAAALAGCLALPQEPIPRRQHGYEAHRHDREQRRRTDRLVRTSRRLYPPVDHDADAPQQEA